MFVATPRRCYLIKYTSGGCVAILRGLIAFVLNNILHLDKKLKEIEFFHNKYKYKSSISRKTFW